MRDPAAISMWHLETLFKSRSRSGLQVPPPLTLKSHVLPVAYKNQTLTERPHAAAKKLQTLKKLLQVDLSAL